jgi:SH3-like domain-containing protein
MNCSSVSALLSLDLRSRSLLLAALTCATIPALADTVVIRGDRVNVRSQPSLEGEVLAWMKRGETVETQASSKDGFIRIALPPKVAVWVYGPLVDRVSHQVKAPEARLRVGPGRNYGELGLIKKGATLIEIRESDGWLQVEPPAGLSAYVGAQFIELHTGAYAEVFHQKAERNRELERLVSASERAHQVGLRVNAGHGLNRENLPLLHVVPHLEELNIGHSIISRAIFVGLEKAVQEILQAMEGYGGKAQTLPAP